MNFTAFILAGGTGTRFWPLSRRDRPKQLLSIGNHPVMIRDTVDRLKRSVDDDRIFIITADEHATPVREEIHELPDENVIVEPTGRDTAACAGLTGLITSERFDKETVVGFFPADHKIEDDAQFDSALEQAVEACQNTSNIVTFGITPDRPATGYGYILPSDESSRANSLVPVKKFTEKPNRNRALELIESHSALWNSGIFFWGAETILGEIQSSLPSLHRGLEKIRYSWRNDGTLNQALEAYYDTLPETSVDFGIMEESSSILVLPVNFGWKDLGTWDSLKKLVEKNDKGNHTIGDTVTLDVEDSILFNEGGPTIGAIGLDDVVIVSTEDVVMVCPVERSEDVKALYERIEDMERTELL